MSSALDTIPLTKIDGTPATLADYAGKVLLIVNVASKCGLTVQYEGLEALYQKHRGAGLVVLGFPANNFKGQEPGTNEEIATFCRATYGVDFDMFAKVSVAGDDQSPLYRELIAAQPRRTLPASAPEQVTAKKDDPAVRWNFEKFLVDRHGDVVGRFDPNVTPEDPILVGAVEKELAKA